MKTTLFFCVLFLPVFCLAQSLDVKNVDAEGDGTTTVEIHKGKKADNDTPKWEVQDGTTDIAGDSAAMVNEAKQSWKKACDDWNKQFRQDNKENKIINVTCGTPSCGGEVGSKTCTSKATYKIKTRLN